VRPSISHALHAHRSMARRHATQTPEQVAQASHIGALGVLQSPVTRELRCGLFRLSRTDWGIAGWLPNEHPSETALLSQQRWKLPRSSLCRAYNSVVA
jgi:hypothetical protein